MLSSVSQLAHSSQDGSPSAELGEEAFREYGCLLAQDVQVGEAFGACR